MPTIFQKPQSIDWGFFIAVISRVYVVFRGWKGKHLTIPWADTIIYYFSQVIAVQFFEFCQPRFWVIAQ